MNPWDLSCRSKLPLGSPGERLAAGCIGGNNLVGSTAVATTIAVAAATAVAHHKLHLPDSKGILPFTCANLTAVTATTVSYRQSSYATSTSSLATSPGASSVAFSSSSPLSSTTTSSSSSLSSASSLLSRSPSSSAASTKSSDSPSPICSRSGSFHSASSDNQNAIQFTNAFEMHPQTNSSSKPSSTIPQSAANIRVAPIVVSAIGQQQAVSVDAATNASEADSNANPIGPLLDRKARKKDQNRRAAYNYRRKKTEEKNRMREDEMRLVYSRVCLIGYAEELEGSIMYILNTKTRKILDNKGNAICFLCPICLHSCDNALNLRSHLKVIHHSNASC